MARLRRNFQSGFVSGPLPATGTTATLFSPELANLPAVSGSDYIVLVLDPNGEYGAPEIVWLTAHTVNATSGTISRAQEGSLARVHPLNTRWINALSAQDLDGFVATTAANGTQTMTGQLVVIAGAAATVAQISRGAASQTGNLAEWQNSASAILARVSSAGAVYGTGVYDTNNRVYSASNPVPDNTAYVHIANTETITGIKTFSAATTFTGTFKVGSATTGTIAIGDGSFTKATGSGFNFNSTIISTGATFNGDTLVVSTNTATPGAIIRGAVSQTADLQQFQNSASTVLSRVDAAGLIYEGANRVYSAGNANLAAAVTTANTYGLAAVLGTGTTYARADHHHGTPPAQVISVSGAGITATLSGVNYTLSNTGATSVAGRTGAVVLTAADIAAGTFPGTAYTFTGTAASTAFLANVDGTVAAPAFRFGAPSNTGMFSPGTDIVALAAGGLEVFRSTNAAGVLSSIVTGTLNTTGILTENGVRVFSATTPNLAPTVAGALTYGLAAVLGTGVTFARNDHHHGTPPSQVITAGAGISAPATGVNYTITNTGVLSNLAGAGISVSGATGNVTVTNTGVLSALAGTNIAVSSGTGNVTFSTVAAPTFSGDVTAMNYQTTGTYNSTAGGMSTQLAWNELFFTRVGASYIRQHGIGGSLVFTTSNVSYGDVTALTLAANGGATFGTTLAVTGASTFTGLTTHSGGVTTPADITISGTGGQLNLSAAGGTVTGTGTGIGDKINLYAADWGFGIQSSRLVAFINSTSSSAFAIRVSAGSGNKSSGADVHTFFSNGNATHTGTLTVNSTSTFTGRTTHSQGAALTAAAATVVLDVLGAASATADLAQFRTAAGLVTRFGPDGSLNVNSTNVANNALKINSLAAAGTVSIFQGAASQTGDLAQWQTSAAAILTKIDKDGNIYVNNRAFFGTLSYIGNTTIFAQSKAAGDVNTVLRHAAAGTADLLQFQNSAGTVLADFDANGYLQTNMVGIGTAPATYGLSVATAANDNVFTMGGTNRTVRLNAFGLTTNSTVTTGRLDVTGNGQLEVYVPDASPARKGIYIQGAVNQTGDLIDMRKSDGTQVARIDANGVATFSGSVVSNGSIEAVSPTATTVTFSARGAVGQSANLTEWRDSAGTVLSYVTPTGSIFVGGSQVVTNATLPSDLARTGSSNSFVGTNTFSPSAATGIPLISKGFSGQTANLQEWQTSSGLVKASISAGGDALFDDLHIPTGQFAINGAFLSNTAAAVYSSSATQVPGVYRGFASQSADLTQWQNSASTTLSRVDSVGAGYFPEVYRTVTSSTGSSGLGPTNLASSPYGSRVWHDKVRFLAPSLSQIAPTTSGQVWTTTGAPTTSTLLNVLNGRTDTPVQILSEANPSFRMTWNAAGFAYGYIQHLLIGFQYRLPGASSVIVTWETSVDGVTWVTRGTSSPSSASANWLAMTVADNVDHGYARATFVGTFPAAGNGSAALVTFQALSGRPGDQGAGIQNDLPFSWNGFKAVTLQPTSAASVAVVAKAASSQTANIQEWQNSAGTVLSSVGPAGRFAAADGTVAAPGFRFQSDTDTGIYRPAADQIGFGVAGVNRVTVSATAFASVLPLTAPTATFTTTAAATPALILKAAASQTANIATFQNSAGAEVSSIGPQGRFTAPAGLSTDPGFRFLGDTNTGFYRPAADSIAITTSGSLATQWDSINRQWQHGNFLLNTADAKIVKNAITGTLTGTNKIFDHVVGYSSNSASITGAIQFTAPYTGATTMMQKLSIEGYTYDSNGPLGIELGFYCTTSTTAPPSIVNSGFSSEGSLKPAVRVGYSPALVADMAAPTLSTAATGGTLADGTYNYRVSAYVQGGETRPVTSAAITTAGGNLSTVTVTWTAVAGATGYRVWRTAVNGAAGTELALASPGNVTTYTDTGAVAPAGAIPAKNTTMDASKVVITLGDVNTVWQYPKFFITRAISTHGTFSDTVMDGWTSSLVTSFAPIGAQVTVANKDGIFQNITVSATLPTGVPAIFRGAVSQTADLLQFQNSAGTTMSRVAADGSLNVNIASIANNALAVQSMNAGGVPTIFRGAASQTGDLTQWQDSAGATIAKVSATGIITASRPDATAQSVFLQGGDATGINLTATSGSANSKTFKIGNLQAVGDTLSPANNIIQMNLGISGTPVTVATFGQATTTITPFAAASVGLTVKGAASQTADLTQWQNSSSVVLASVGPAGRFAAADGTVAAPGFRFQSDTDTGMYRVAADQIGFSVAGVNRLSLSASAFASTVPVTGTSATFAVTAPATTPLIAKGAASQTANLQEWQDSAGTAVAKVSSAGWLQSSVIRNMAGAGPYFSMGTSSIIAITATAANVGLAVRGMVAQTGNLQEWQGDTGTVLASVGPAGRFAAADGTAAAPGFRFQSDTNTGIYRIAADQIGFSVAGVNRLSLTATSFASTLPVTAPTATFTTTAAATTPLIVKGAASQTAGLQEWQDSAGSVLTKVFSSGTFATAGRIIAGDASGVVLPSYLVVVTAGGGLSNPSSIIRGQTSQTGDLTQWQNSAGATVANVTPSGQVIGTGFASLTDGTAASPAYRFGPASDSGLYQPATDQFAFSAGGIQKLLGTTVSVFAISNAATSVPLVAKAAAAQTANLMEWQDSTGAVLSRVANDGTIWVGATKLQAGSTSANTALDTEIFGFMGVF